MITSKEYSAVTGFLYIAIIPSRWQTCYWIINFWNISFFSRDLLVLQQITFSWFCLLCEIQLFCCLVTLWVIQGLSSQLLEDLTIKEIFDLDNQQTFNVCTYSAVRKFCSWVKSDLDYILDIGVNLNNYLGYVARLLNKDEVPNAVFFFGKLSNANSGIWIGKRTNKPERKWKLLTSLMRVNVETV